MYIALTETQSKKVMVNRQVHIVTKHNGSIILIFQEQLPEIDSHAVAISGVRPHAHFISAIHAKDIVQRASNSHSMKYEQR